MKNLNVLLIRLIFVFVSSTSLAQNSWSIEFRPEINFRTQDFGDAKLKTGYGFEVDVVYNFIGRFGAYFGWGYKTFSSENISFAGTLNDFNETGYLFGLQYTSPFIKSNSLSYFLRTGLNYNKIEIKNSNGKTISDSGHGIGWQACMGIIYNIINNWSLQPTAKYTSSARDFNIENKITNGQLSYFSLCLGISKTF